MVFQGFKAGRAVQLRHVWIADHQNLTPFPNSSLKKRFPSLLETSVSNHHFIGITIERYSDAAVRQWRSSGHQHEAASGPHPAGQTIPRGRKVCRNPVRSHGGIGTLAQLPHGLGIPVAGLGSDQSVRADSSRNGSGDELQFHRLGCQ
jgi:hypothetical protein